MVVNKVSQREIIEVPFQLPSGEVKNHPALVLSTSRLSDAEDGMFYAVLISTKNYLPDYTIKIEDDWLSKSMPSESYFVTHIVSFYKLNDVIQSNNRFVKKEFFGKILAKVLDSMFDIEVEFE